MQRSHSYPLVQLIVRRRCFVSGRICVENANDRCSSWLRRVVAPLELGQRRLVRTLTSQGLGTGVEIVEHSVDSTTRTIAVGECLGSYPRGYCTRGTTEAVLPELATRHGLRFCRPMKSCEYRHRTSEGVKQTSMALFASGFDECYSCVSNSGLSDAFCAGKGEAHAEGPMARE